MAWQPELESSQSLVEAFPATLMKASRRHAGKSTADRVRNGHAKILCHVPKCANDLHAALRGELLPGGATVRRFVRAYHQEGLGSSRAVRLEVGVTVCRAEAASGRNPGTFCALRSVDSCL